MKFTVATTALLLANCGASTTTTTIGSGKKLTLRPSLPVEGGLRAPISNHHHDKRPVVRKLLRRLSEKKQQAAKQESTTAVDSSTSTQPDLGILGKNHHRHSRRRLAAEEASEPRKESIRDEPFRESGANAVVTSETLLTNGYYNARLDLVRYACEEYQGCDCEGFDFDSFSGTLECNYSEQPESSDLCQSTINYCGEPVEICYRNTLVLEAKDAANYKYTTCVTYTEPYQQHVCLTLDRNYYSTDDGARRMLEEENEETDTNSTTVVSATPFEQSCTVKFNNVECDSCLARLKSYPQYDIHTRCFEIDCSNTGDETNIVNTCEENDDVPLPTTLSDNVVFGDDCTRCQPCGLGHHVTNLDAEGYFPLIGEYKCSGLELAAKIGFFDRKFCPEVQTKTSEYCGCEPDFFDALLVVPPPPQEEVSRNDLTQTSLPIADAVPPVFLPGDTFNDKACDVCGDTRAKVAIPRNIVSLPDGIQTSCDALQAAGLLGMFTTDYCKKTIQPLVFLNCGGCFHDQDVNIVDADDILGPQSREFSFQQTTIDGELSKPASSTFVTDKNFAQSYCQICEDDSDLAFPDNHVMLPQGLTTCQVFGIELKGGSFSESFCLNEANVLANRFCGGCLATAKADEDSVSEEASREEDSETLDNTAQAATLLANNALKLGQEKPHQVDGGASDKVPNDDSISVPVHQDNGGGMGIVISRMEEAKKDAPSDRMQHHEAPEEIDVETDPSAGDETTEQRSESVSKPIPNEASTIISSGSCTRRLESCGGSIWMMATTMALTLVAVYFS